MFQREPRVRLVDNFGTFEIKNVLIFPRPTITCSNAHSEKYVHFQFTRWSGLTTVFSFDYLPHTMVIEMK